MQDFEVTTTAEPMAINFLVNDERYAIPLVQIRAFPLKSALINVLTEKYLNSSFGVELSPDGDIIIKPPGDPAVIEGLFKWNNRSTYDCVGYGFKAVVRIYANPKITVHELLCLNTLTELMGIAASDTTFNTAEVLEQHPIYNLLRESNYNNFLQELDYYGVLPLFQSSLATGGIDCEVMIENFRSNMRDLFPTTDGISKQDSAREDFFRTILSLGGMFSGSFLLRSVLGEDWGENNPSDVDIYVNIHMLEGMLGHRTIEKRFEQFSKTGKRIEAHVKKLAGSTTQDLDAAVVQISIRPSKIVEALSKFESREEAVQEYREGIAKRVMKWLWAKSATIAPSDVGHSYGFTDRIAYIIKIEMELFKVDLVVLTSTVPYGIEDNFDFDFCKVYYDGYVIHALDWDAVANKRSVERSHQHHNHKTWFSNHVRIAKYMRRGFIITTPDTPEYLANKPKDSKPSGLDHSLGGATVKEDASDIIPFEVTIV